MVTESQTPTNASNTDRIERRYVFKAPRSRMWRALSDTREFGSWFGINLQSAFMEGQSAQGRLTFKGYEHVVVDMLVERVTPERYFAYRWHPYAIDPKVDYSTEPTTLVEFTLEDAEGGTALTIVESGFDRIPPGRRIEAFRMNEKGWEGQIKSLQKFVE